MGRGEQSLLERGALDTAAREPHVTYQVEGKAFRRVLAGIEPIYQEVLRGRVFVALHRHAGDSYV